MWLFYAYAGPLLIIITITMDNYFKRHNSDPPSINI